MSLGLALWILVVPAADWSWTILDGPFDSAVSCEARRGARLDADNTLCARLPTHHQEDSPPSGGPSWESGEVAVTTAQKIRSRVTTSIRLQVRVSRGSPGVQASGGHDA